MSCGITRRALLAGGAAALASSVVEGKTKPAKKAAPQKETTKVESFRASGGPVGDLLVVQFDDAQWDDFTPDVIPFLMSLPNLTTLPNYFPTTPVCGPSRSSLLTGLYAHNHGVHVNDPGYPKLTAAARQQEISIPLATVPTVYSALAGKYINGWSGGHKPGKWNFWGGVADPVYHMNGGYSTHVFRDRLLTALAKCPNGSDFVGFYNVKAPHGPATPEKQYKHLHDGEQAPRTPAFDEADMSDKPKFIAKAGVAGPKAIAKIDAWTRKRRDTMKSVDDDVKLLYDKLINPLVLIFTDNGYLLLDHNRSGKNVAYNSSGRCPAFISNPHGSGGTDERIVANIDWYSMILNRYGAAVPENDGADIFAVQRDVLLTEGWHGKDGPAEGLIHTETAPPDWKALCGKDYRYVSYATGEEEFYDLKADPWELENKADSTDLTEYRNRLAGLKDCNGGSCIQ